MFDCRMKIGSDIFNFFVYYKNDDDTSKRVLNLDEQLQQRWIAEAAHFTWVLLEEKKVRETREEWTEFSWLGITHN